MPRLFLALNVPPKSKALILNVPLRLRGIKGVIFVTPLAPLILRGGIVSCRSYLKRGILGNVLRRGVFVKIEKLSQ